MPSHYLNQKLTPAKRLTNNVHLNQNIVILTKVSSLAALHGSCQTKIFDADSDENFIKMTFPFQCLFGWSPTRWWVRFFFTTIRPYVPLLKIHDHVNKESVQSSSGHKPWKSRTTWYVCGPNLPATYMKISNITCKHFASLLRCDDMSAVKVWGTNEYIPGETTDTFK